MRVIQQLSQRQFVERTQGKLLDHQPLFRSTEEEAEEVKLKLKRSKKRLEIILAQITAEEMDGDDLEKAIYEFFKFSDNISYSFSNCVRALSMYQYCELECGPADSFLIPHLKSLLNFCTEVEVKVHTFSEPKILGKAGRIVTQFAANQTCALECKTPRTSESTLEKVISNFADRIIWHAQQRVDLFFYMLVAYYNTKRVVASSETSLQHGKGNKSKNLQACHSSLFPGLSDNQGGLLNNTHLLHSNNATVNLPKLVNDVDGHLEGRRAMSACRVGALEILNKCAAGRLNPEAALKAFLILMQTSFTQSASYLNKQSAGRRPALQKVLALQKQGTFCCANPSDLSPYVNLLLGRKNDEALEDAFKRVQKEILDNQASMRPLH